MIAQSPKQQFGCLRKLFHQRQYNTYIKGYTKKEVQYITTFACVYEKYSTLVGVLRQIQHPASTHAVLASQHALYFPYTHVAML